MYPLTVVYDEPADKEALDRRYTEEHVPLVNASPPLTTMRQPFDRISREMVRLLIAQIDGEQPGAVIIPTRVVLRELA